MTRYEQIKSISVDDAVFRNGNAKLLQKHGLHRIAHIVEKCNFKCDGIFWDHNISEIPPVVGCVGNICHAMLYEMINKYFVKVEIDSIIHLKYRTIKVNVHSYEREVVKDNFDVRDSGIDMCKSIIVLQADSEKFGVYFKQVESAIHFIYAIKKRQSEFKDEIDLFVQHCREVTKSS